MKNHPNTAIFPEHLIPFNAGLKRLKQRNGNGCNRQLLHRWTTKGIKNPCPGKNGCGKQLFLEWMQFPGGRVTSEEAFKRFILRCSGVNVKSPVSRKKPKGKP